MEKTTVLIERNPPVNIRITGNLTAWPFKDLRLVDLEFPDKDLILNPKAREVLEKLSQCSGILNFNIFLRPNGMRVSTAGMISRTKVIEELEQFLRSVLGKDILIEKKLDGWL